MTEQTQPVVEQKFSLQVMKRDSNFILVTSKLATLSKDMEHLEIKTTDDMEIAALFRSEAVTYLGKLEEIRMKYKRPFLDHMTDVDKNFKLLTAPVHAGLEILDVRIKDHRTAERKKDEEETKRAEEEKARAEIERLKRIEEEKVKVEEKTGVKIEKTAEELSKEMEKIPAMVSGKVEVAPGVEMKVEPILERSSPMIGPPKKLSEQTGGLLQGKMVWKWEITNAEELPRAYLMIDPQLCADAVLVMMAPREFLIPNEKQINIAVKKEEVREIEGLRIFPEEELASKKFKK